MIRQAEQRIYNTVQIANLRRNVTGFCSANIKYLQCPADMLSVYSLAVIKTNGDYLFLLNKDVNFVREAYPAPASAGLPKHYAIFGTNLQALPNELTFILGPTPDIAYQFELHYFYYPQSITTVASERTWLGENFDSALLNATLYEGSMFLKQEPDLVASAKDKYVQSIALLKNLGDGKQRMDAYRDGQVRVQVS